MEGIEVLAGSEVNILPDGSAGLRGRAAGGARLGGGERAHVPSGWAQEAMTERMIRAIEHPLVDAIGHPTGRMIERREPYAIDLEAVGEAAARTGTLFEINANPDRRDLSDVNARNAARAGVTIVIDSDAHKVRDAANMRWGIATARRAWLRKEDVANTRPWKWSCVGRRKRNRPSIQGSPIELRITQWAVERQLATRTTTADFRRSTHTPVPSLKRVHGGGSLRRERFMHEDGRLR